MATEDQTQTDEPVEQPWAAEGFLRWAIRTGLYEPFAPTKPTDLLWAAVWTLVAIVVRVNIDFPASWLLPRAALAYLVAGYSTLFLAYLVHYAYQGGAALIRRARA